MRLLVTGGAGFIGANLCRAATAHPAIERVTALDDLSTGLKTALDTVDVDLTIGSVLDETTLSSVFKGVDVVVHLAAVPSVARSIADPWTSHEANATGTVRVLEAARRSQVGHIIIASSSSVYGANPELPKREDAWTRPLSPYAASKLATEGYALAYQESYGLPTLVLRFFNVFGPGQAADHAYAAVIPRFLSAVLRGEPVEVYGDGHQSRDFTFVDTVCRVLLDALSRRVHAPGPVNLAFGERTTLLELLATMESVLGRRIDVTHRPSRVGDVRHSQADPTLLHQLFPTVVPTPLADGLRATAHWLALTSTFPADQRDLLR